MKLLQTDRPGRLRDTTVFLSGSVPNREGFKRVPDAPFVIEQAVVGLARAVLAEGGRIVFGAHPSISPLVASVASEYKTVGQSGEPSRVIIYQSRAFEEVLPDETWDMVRFGFADLIWTDAKNGERYRKGEPASRYCPKSLTHMRERMIGETLPRLMVIVGGMDGVYEEVDLFQTLWRSSEESGGASIYSAVRTGGAAQIVPGRERKGPLELRVLEEEWVRIEPAGEVKRIAIDLREFPIPPYPAMMQWLVRHISGG
jgi:hypothetical protein